MLKKLKKLLYEEVPNLSLWYGVFFALGIGVYFALPVEPNLWGSCFLAFTTGVIWFLGRKEFLSRLILGYLFFACFGFCVVTANMVAAPVLPHAVFDAGVTGRVVKVEPLAEGQRITLDNVNIENVSSYYTPERIRLNFLSKTPIMNVGDRIEGRAHIFPPMAPAQIGAYNFARTAWYMRLGGVGRLTELTDYDAVGKISSVSQKLEHLRQTIMHRVQYALLPEAASVAIPLIIGEQGTVSSRTYDLYRQAGIVHVLSVSGFHLTLLAGLVFFLIRGLLSLFSGLDGRVNTKKIAAFLALLVVLFYLLISGMQVPAVRSFLMIAFVLIAVMFDRRAISLRTAVLAGCFILFLWPETLMSVSFQLSFMAVFALVSLYEVIMKHLSVTHLRRFWWYKIWWLILGTMCVSLLASLATAPYTIYHFNQFAIYGVLGNLLTSILFSFIIMPLLLAAVLCMPFGWEEIFLKIAGYFFAQITSICEWITTLPYADMVIPSFDDWGLIVMSFGLVWMFLLTTKLRWLGVLVIAIGLFSFYTIDKPDILVAEGGKVFAVRDESNNWVLSTTDGNRLVSDTWLRRNGQNPKTYPDDRVYDQTAVRILGHKIAFSSLNCVNAEVTFITAWEVGDCLGKVYDKKDLWLNKTHEVYVTPSEIIVKNVKETMGKRLWNPSFLVAEPEKTNYNSDNNLW